MAFYCINYTTGVNTPSGGTPAAPWQTIAYAETQINGGLGPQVGDEFRIQDDAVKTLLGTARINTLNTLGNASFAPNTVLVAGDIIMIGDSQFPCWIASVTSTTIVAGTGSSNPMWTGIDQGVDTPIFKITGSVDVVTTSGAAFLDSINFASAFAFTPGANNIIISGGWDATFLAKTTFGRTHFKRTGSFNTTAVNQTGSVFRLGSMYGYQFKDLVYNRLFFANSSSTTVPHAAMNFDNIVMCGTLNPMGGLGVNTATNVFTNTWNNCYFNVGTSRSFFGLATTGQSIVINNPTLVYDSGWNSAPMSSFDNLNGRTDGTFAKFLRISCTGTIYFENYFTGEANPQFQISAGTTRVMNQVSNYLFLKTGTVFFSKSGSGFGADFIVDYQLNVTTQLMNLLTTPFDFGSQSSSLTLTVPGFTNSLNALSNRQIFSAGTRGINVGPKGGMVTWIDTVNNKTYQIENYSASRINTTEHVTGTNCIEWKSGSVNKAGTERLILNGVNIKDGQTVQVTVSMKSPTATTTPDLRLVMATGLNAVLQVTSLSQEFAGIFTKTSGNISTTYTDIVYTVTTPVLATLAGSRTAVIALSLTGPNLPAHDYFIDKITTNIA